MFGEIISLTNEHNGCHFVNLLGHTMNFEEFENCLGEIYQNNWNEYELQVTELDTVYISRIDKWRITRFYKKYNKKIIRTNLKPGATAVDDNDNDMWYDKECRATRIVVRQIPSPAYERL